MWLMRLRISDFTQLWVFYVGEKEVHNILEKVEKMAH